MRVVIVGGGMAGLVLTHALVARGVTPTVLERMPAGAPAPGPILLPFLAYDALQDIGRYDEIRAAGWDIGPKEGAPPVAIAVARDDVLAALRRDAVVEHETEVLELLRVPDPDAPGGERVAGVRVRGPGGEREIPADLVVGADGSHSRVREMAGIAAEVRLSEGAGMSFTSPVVIDRSFAMAYQSNGRQVGLVGWPGGSAGWWQVDRVEGGEPAARAPGVEAFKRSFTRLLPVAAAALEGVTAIEQIGLPRDDRGALRDLVDAGRGADRRGRPRDRPRGRRRAPAWASATPWRWPSRSPAPRTRTPPPATTSSGAGRRSRPTRRSAPRGPGSCPRGAAGSPTRSAGRPSTEFGLPKAGSSTSKDRGRRRAVHRSFTSWSHGGPLRLRGAR